MVDRFADGDPSNNQNIDRDDPQAFHGGDIQGLLDHLDYFQDLGVSTLWLSPVFQMRTQPFHGWGAYHGYWVWDMGKVEPRFGTQALLRELSDQLHARGMRLLLDMVYNHVGYDAPLLLDKPGWFHHNGSISDWNDPVQLVEYDVHGLPDLAQELPEVYDYLLRQSLDWISRVQPDGFRIDAVRHMPLSFTAKLASDLRARAGEGFLMLGEDFQGDPGQLAQAFRDGGFGAVFDFPLYYAMIDVFCRDANPGRIAALLSLDRLYPDPNRLVTFLDNHDLPRLASQCASDPERAGQALAFQLTARGIPSITWGTEMGLKGGGEPENRGDMRFVQRYPLHRQAKALLALRSAHPALSSGHGRILDLGPEHLVYSREAPGEMALLALNTGDAVADLALPGPVATGVDLSPAWGPATVAQGIMRLPARSFSVLFHRRNTHPGMAVWVGALAEPAPSLHQAGSESSESRTVIFRAIGPALEPGMELLLTGGGPELGQWNHDGDAPVFRPAPMPSPGNSCEQREFSLELLLPADSVVEFKLVMRHADGRLRWQEGANHYLFIPPGDEPLETILHW